MIPIDVYRTGRPWWRRPWQSEPFGPIPEAWRRCPTAFTRKGATKKGLRYWAQVKEAAA